MDNIGDDFNTENIRCNLGFMEHTVINMFYTDNDIKALRIKIRWLLSIKMIL